MSNNEASHPKVFISYSHDSREHANHVLALADHLRTDGIDCVLDQYEDSPPEGFPRWMDRHIRAADFVLMICTPTYYRRVMGEEKPRMGLGVAWESMLIYQYIYNADTANARFIPILLEGGSPADIPTPWQGVPHYRPTTEEGYEALYRRLTHQPLTPKGELGMLRKLPPRERTQDFLKEGSDESASPSLWNVPYERNAFFTGREHILQELHEALSQNSATALTQVKAISGLGGIGKTQTAVEYCYRYQSEYQAVLWTRAETKEVLQTGFVEIARLIGLPEWNAPNPLTTVQAVRKWLETTSGWLLVFDNADDPALLQGYRPHQAKGHILLTSRAHVFDLVGIARPIALEVMPPQEAVAFLFRRTGRDDPNPLEHVAAEQLAVELGYLPLALEQAGAYVVEHSARFQDYLASYRKQRLAVLNKSHPKTGDYPASVATTWDINVREVGKTPGAVDLLRLSAFLSPEGIPLELITNGANHLGPVLADVLAQTKEDPLVLHELLEPLTRYSLIQRDVETHTYSIHRLVQEVVKDALDIDQQQLWAQRAVRVVNESFPFNEVAPWPLSQRYLSHALICEAHITQWAMVFFEAGYLLRKVGIYFSRQGSYHEAEPLYQQALSICERVLGPDHPNTAQSLSDLASLYHDQGRYEQAGPLYQRALSIRERVLGPDHPDTAQSLNNLANFYHDQGRYEQAGPLYQRALSICERVLGPDHPDTAQILNNQANLYRDQGKDEQAELLYQQALSIRERVLGPDHPDTAQSLNNLANLYSTQGKDEQAEPLLQRALFIRERVLGPDHPKTASSLTTLANLYYNQGKDEQAELLYQQALSIRERMLGSNHPDTAHILNNLANLYRHQGKHEQAEPLLQKAFTIKEGLLGPNHPVTAQILNNLASLYHNQGKDEQAESLFQQALSIFERVLGPDHPYTAQGLYNLASLYHDQGKDEQAEVLYQQALAIRERVLGPNHLDMASSLNNLAVLYHAQGKDEQAEPLLQRALSIRERVLGPDHLDTASSFNNLAVLYRDQGKDEQAKLLYQRALAIYERVLGPNHSITKTVRESYAQIQQKMEEATSQHDE